MKTNYCNSIRCAVLLTWLLFISVHATMAQVNYCQPDPPNIPDSCASQIGNNTMASGNSSFAAGQFTEALGISSISLGHYSIASGHYSVAIGQSNYSSSQSYSFGQGAMAYGQQSLAIGRYVETNSTAMNSMVIGSGSSSCILKNNIPNSLMIGFYSTIPTLFIGMSASTNGIGKVGIGTTNPVARLQVADGDIFIQDINKGIIMKSPDGSCWRGTVNDSGQLNFEKLDDCENLITKTDESENVTPVNIFPNPANDFIEISCPASEIGKYHTISIYNSAGQQVITQTFNNESKRISTSDLTQGTYIVKLSGQGSGYADVVVIAR